MKLTKKAKDLLEKLNNLQEDINQELQDMIDTRTDTFDDRSEKWQESEKGEAFMDLTDELEGKLDEIDTAINEAGDFMDEIESL